MNAIPGPWRSAILFLPLISLAFGFFCVTLGPEFATHYGSGIVIGCLVSLPYWHSYRGLGVAVVSLIATAAIGTWVHIAGEWSDKTVILASMGLGAAFARIFLYLYFEGVSGTRTRLLALLLLVVCIASLFLGAWVIEGPSPKDRPPPEIVWFPAFTGLLAVLSIAFLFRFAFELAVEPVLWLMYRIRCVGPGYLPARGPCLIIANHACWFDPVFLAKVLPRPITAMMTSRFYDKPALRGLFKYVLCAIRVPEKALKQDVPPEIHEAIDALDRGECVVIFPEGYMRRSEEKPLRRFGRGVWQILAARPATPVFACWIEGNWGSYTSYFNGKPTQNKRPDLRRRIGIGVAAPILVDAATLANHHQTRIALMNRVIESRKLLGLPDLPPFELPETEQDQGSENSD